LQPPAAPAHELIAFRQVRMLLKTSSAYLRFLNLASAIRDITAFPEMDSVEESLLNAVVLADFNKSALTVLQAMEILPNVSSSTASRRLKTLRKSGLVELVGDAGDERIRYVMPTPLAQRYFAQMGECLRQAQT